MRQSVWAPLCPQCSAPSLPSKLLPQLGGVGASRERTRIAATYTAWPQTQRPTMGRCLLLARPLLQMRKRGRHRGVKEPDRDRPALKQQAELGSALWWSSSAQPCMRSSLGHPPGRDSEGWGAVTGGGESEVGDGQSSRRTFPVLRNKGGLLTSERRVCAHSRLSCRLRAMGSWGIGAGEMNLDTHPF